MPEYQVPLEELRAAALTPEEPEVDQITDAFREGMSAGLDFAYRIAEDLYHDLDRSGMAAAPIKAEAVQMVMERLVSEHDLRSDQPIREIRQERATAQASDEVLADLRRALATPLGVDPLTNYRLRSDQVILPADPGPTTMNLVSDAAFDEWVNIDAGHGLDPVQVNPRALEFGPTATAVTPATLAPDASCACGAIPGLSSGVVSDGSTTHRTTGPCTVRVERS